MKSKHGAKARNGEKKPWWETVSGIAGAVAAVAALAAGVWQFASPRHSVEVTVKAGTWTPLGKDTVENRDRWAVDSVSGKMVRQDAETSGPRFRYGFDVEFKNTGNRPITMTAAEQRNLTICANVPRRPWEIGPTIEILGQDKVSENVAVTSKLNNLLQVTLRHIGLMGSETVHLECLSPIGDLGGVFIISRDELFSVRPYPEGYQAIESANNLK